MRTKEKPSAIICSDIHLREDVPVCRTDDFWTTQWHKLDFISQLQNDHKCIVIHAGDLFDYWKPSPYLLSKAINHLPNNFHTIYGQHDLPQHSFELRHKSGINVLDTAGKIKVLSTCHFGEEPSKASMLFPTNNGKLRSMLVWHTYNYQGRMPWPDCPAPTARKLLKKYPEYDVIITGDNHQTFIEMYEGRILVNPGSMMRNDADQYDFQPSVFLYYAESNTIKRVFIPIENDVISRDHIERKRERDDRLESFISHLNNDFEATISFEENVNRMVESNKIPRSVQIIINQAVFE